MSRFLAVQAAVCPTADSMLLATHSSLMCCVQASFTLNVLEHGPVEGFVGFFDTQFKVGFWGCC